MEDGSPQQGPKNLRQKQIGDRAQLISSGGMSGDVHTQPAELLDQPPDFRAAGRNFLRDLGSAHDYRRVLHQEPDDETQAQIGRLKLMWS